MTSTALRRLEHRVAIEELHGRYAELCDQGFPPDRIADLFVADGVWESAPNGVTRRGRDEIAEHFRVAGAAYPWALHVNVPVRITLAEDERHATGVWYLLMPCVDETGGTARAGWLAGRYDNEFVWRDGCWRYRRIHVDFGLMAHHLGDWSQDRYSLAAHEG